MDSRLLASGLIITKSCTQRLPKPRPLRSECLSIDHHDALSAIHRGATRSLKLDLSPLLRMFQSPGSARISKVPKIIKIPTSEESRFWERKQQEQRRHFVYLEVHGALNWVLEADQMYLERPENGPFCMSSKIIVSTNEILLVPSLTF